MLRNPVETVCPYCKKRYVKTHINQRYCSKLCYYKANGLIGKDATEIKKKPRICIFCDEPFKINRRDKAQWKRKHCFKPQCIKRHWLRNLLTTYTRCKDKECTNIITRNQNTPWGTYFYCPFCIATNKARRETYIKWIKTLPPYIEALVPKQRIPIKRLTQYVRNYDVDLIPDAITNIH